MTHCGQTCSKPFHVFTYILKRKGYFLQENNESIFVKIRSNFDKGLNFRNLAFKMSFNQNHPLKMELTLVHMYITWSFLFIF